MRPANNALDFVLTVLSRFAQAHIAVWLAGGWAEELWGLCPPRQHGDVDLLYPAPDFQRLDDWLSQTQDMLPIQGKRFSHKRAVLHEQVMIEIVLLEPQSRGYNTHYFDNRFLLTWPQDSLGYLMVEQHLVPVASCQALQLYRQCYSQIAQAYQIYLQEQRKIMTFVNITNCNFQKD